MMNLRNIRRVTAEQIAHAHRWMDHHGVLIVPLTDEQKKLTEDAGHTDCPLCNCGLGIQGSKNTPEDSLIDAIIPVTMMVSSILHQMHSVGNLPDDPTEQIVHAIAAALRMLRAMTEVP